jgi:hypothetical protein
LFATGKAKRDKEQVTREWDSIYNNPNTRAFANELFRYAVMSGMSYGSGTLYDYAPASVKAASEAYMNCLDSINSKRLDDNSEIANFMKLFVLNNYKTKTLTEELDVKKPTEFMSEGSVNIDKTTINEYRLYTVTEKRKTRYYVYDKKQKGFQEIFPNTNFLDNYKVYTEFEDVSNFGKSKKLESSSSTTDAIEGDNPNAINLGGAPTVSNSAIDTQMPDRGVTFGRNKSEVPAEAVTSVEEITDEDFIAPFRDVVLPTLPKNTLDIIHSEAKPVLIKRNIFEKNIREHPDISSSQSRKILDAALNSSDLLINDKPKLKANY